MKIKSVNILFSVLAFALTATSLPISSDELEKRSPQMAVSIPQTWLPGELSEDSSDEIDIEKRMLQPKRIKLHPAEKRMIQPKKVKPRT